MTEAANLLYPLSEFYAQDQVGLPAATTIEPAQLPEPYRTLLVHESDMTRTLEKHHGQPLRLRLLKRQLQGDEYMRQVLLVTEHGKKVVEFGAIKIHLQYFPSAARILVLQGKLPLGGILNEAKITYLSQPIAYLQVTPDFIIQRALGLKDSTPLYGRRNVLIDASQQILADILELLPPDAI
ncbi:MAG: hypothetical protein U0V70_05110 [Terriglobia bacterium]